MNRIRCYLGFHGGSVEPAYEIAQDIDSRSAFVCSSCGRVIE